MASYIRLEANCTRVEALTEQIMGQIAAEAASSPAVLIPCGGL